MPENVIEHMLSEVDRLLRAQNITERIHFSQEENKLLQEAIVLKK